MGVAVGLAVAVAIALVVYGAVTDDDNDRATVDASSTSAPASAGDGDAIATIGDSGDVVTKIQRLLRDTWGYDVAVDGSYGTQTATAVAAFQAEHGLPANGVVDEATYDALSEEPGPDSTAPQPSSGVPQTGPPPTEVADE